MRQDAKTYTPKEGGGTATGLERGEPENMLLKSFSENWNRYLSETFSARILLPKNVRHKKHISKEYGYLQILVTPLANLLPTVIPQAVTDWPASPSIPPADRRPRQRALIKMAI